MNRLYIFLALIAATIGLNAQPQGYYNGTEGLTGNNLKTALHNIIKNDEHVTYGGMWGAYYTTDRKPGTDFVWDIYSDVPNGTPPYQYVLGDDQCGNYNGEGDCYNREHIWAQSWTANDLNEKTDLHQVFPTDGWVNNKRGNYAFGEVAVVSWVSLNGGKLGSSKLSGFNGTVFEPIDAYKGDVARAMMYVSVRYYMEDSDWVMSDMTNKSVILPWAMEMLLRWHEEDPVDNKEINRNNAIFDIQGNRNPFVDFPDFAEMIWDPTYSLDESQIEMMLVNVWPNPATSTVNIHGDNLDAVYMYNAQGQLVLQLDLHNNDGQSSIDVSAFTEGIYFMNVVSGEGNSVLKKVVVQ